MPVRPSRSCRRIGCTDPSGGPSAHPSACRAYQPVVAGWEQPDRDRHSTRAAASSPPGRRTGPRRAVRAPPRVPVGFHRPTPVERNDIAHPANHAGDNARSPDPPAGGDRMATVDPPENLFHWLDECLVLSVRHCARHWTLTLVTEYPLKLTSPSSERDFVALVFHDVVDLVGTGGGLNYRADQQPSSVAVRGLGPPAGKGRVGSALRAVPRTGLRGLRIRRRPVEPPPVPPAHVRRPPSPPARRTAPAGRPRRADPCTPRSVPRSSRTVREPRRPHPAPW